MRALLVLFTFTLAGLVVSSGEFPWRSMFGQVEEGVSKWKTRSAPQHAADDAEGDSGEGLTADLDIPFTQDSFRSDQPQNHPSIEQSDGDDGSGLTADLDIPFYMGPFSADTPAE